MSLSREHALQPSVLPEWPDTWYVVARSKDIKIGGIFDHSIAGRPFVIFRAASGALTALDAHCPHMGAHLRAGKVIGERLQCALHHWTIDKHGSLYSHEDCKQKNARTWQVAERFGLVFLFAGVGVAPALPCPADLEKFDWLLGKPVTFQTSWYVLMINGFDVLHMLTIHQRELVAPPKFVRGEDGALHFHYTTRVMPGGGLFSWIMKYLSKNTIRVHQTCHGTTVLVESDLGTVRSCAIFGFLQEGPIVRGFTSFGAMRIGAFWWLRLWLTRRFYLSFLRKDYPVVKDMRVVVDGIDDVGVIALRDFLRSLPTLP